MSLQVVFLNSAGRPRMSEEVEWVDYTWIRVDINDVEVKSRDVEKKLFEWCDNAIDFSILLFRISDAFHLRLQPFASSRTDHVGRTIFNSLHIVSNDEADMRMLIVHCLRGEGDFGAELGRQIDGFVQATEQDIGFKVSNGEAFLNFLNDIVEQEKNGQEYTKTLDETFNLNLNIIAARRDLAERLKVNKLPSDQEGILVAVMKNVPREVMLQHKISLGLWHSIRVKFGENEQLPIWEVYTPGQQASTPSVPMKGGSKLPKPSVDEIRQSAKSEEKSYIDLDLSGLDLSEINFPDNSKFRGCKMHGTKFINCTLKKASFVGVDMGDLHDVKPDLFDELFHNPSRNIRIIVKVLLGNSTEFEQLIDEIHKRLRSEDIPQTDFTQSTLTNATFQKVRLSGAIFQSANLRGVDFSDTHLWLADFRKIKYDNKTKWPTVDALSFQLRLPSSAENS